MNAALAIIGAGGFVGARLTESRVLAGAPVRAVVRNFRNMAALCRFGASVDVRRADAEDPVALAEALAGTSVVVNVTTGPPDGIIRSTETIYEACARAGVRRLVHISSAVVYGDVEQPTDDDAPPLTRHWMPYARAKGQAEIWLRSRLDHGGPEIVVLRPGIVWGVRSSHTIDLARSLASKSAYLVDGGRGIFNGIYIDNLVHAIETAAAHGGRVAGFYHVGDREQVTWRTFFGALGQPLGCDVSRLPIVSGERFPHSVRSTIDTIQSLPGVNEMYHRLKTRIPDTVKTTIKARLEGEYTFRRQATVYATQPAVDRELWHLQRVRHKLSGEKFARTFGTRPPVPFAEGIRRTVAWLGTLGWIERRAS